MDNLRIKNFEFNENGRHLLSLESKGKDWPVVYLIHNNKELYVGETSNIYNRFEQHLKNKQRRNLKTIRVIFDDTFNKSAILDIEQYLIQYIGADNKFKLQNLNGGQSAKHNYYQREHYINKLQLIWNKMARLGLVDNSLIDLQNSDVFKYSPYNTLTNEQNEVCTDVLYEMMDCLTKEEKGMSIISGGAGTGKTIVLINMIFKLLSIKRLNFTAEDIEDEFDESLSDNINLLHDLKKFLNKKELKIGYVVPMTSIRKTLSKVFSKIGNGLKAGMVIGPLDVMKEDYDIIFVDEAHRLARYNNISYKGAFKDACDKCNLDYSKVSLLDVIKARSKYQVIVYDENQSVKGSDMTPEQFKNTTSDIITFKHELKTQMRCEGGDTYTNYVDRIFECTQDEFEEVENYDLKIFDEVDEMVKSIKELDKEYGLCRNAAGYSWEWISKGQKSYEDVVNKGLQDIEIQGNKYVWNMTNSEFILSENAINEIGCIHTLQGYDLNYIGLIFGEEIDFDPEKEEIVIDETKFFDKYVKQGADYETLKKYIINSYKVIMERGIKGCYVYACNSNMKNYLKRFMRNK